MLIKGNSGALASVVSGNSGGASAPAAVAVVNGGGGAISGVTLKTPDKAMVTLEWVQELGGWVCEMPQDLLEGGDVIVRVADGVVSITCS